jgi:hypothetical protein
MHNTTRVDINWIVKLYPWSKAFSKHFKHSLSAAPLFDALLAYGVFVLALAEGEVLNKITQFSTRLFS